MPLLSCGWRTAVLTACIVLVGAPAVAGDRPYLATHTAVAEEDDDAVWSVESWAQRLGSVRTLSLAPEYAFNPTTSLQFEFSTSHDRSAIDNGQTAEIEFKHLLNHIARDGYGWGLVASLGLGSAQGGAWRRGAAMIKLPLSLALWESDGALHLNAGLAKEPDARRETLLSAAIEYQVARRTTLFAEAAREGDSTLLHAGVRWWLKKERFALDLAWQRQRVPGSIDSGVVVGLGWYDL
jgi:hypothetical protein